MPALLCLSRICLERLFPDQSALPTLWALGPLVSTAVNCAVSVVPPEPLLCLSDQEPVVGRSCSVALHRFVRGVL